MNFASKDTADQKAGYFKAVIKIDKSIDASTELHAFHEDGSQLTWYPNGFEIKVSNVDSTGPVPKFELVNKTTVKLTNVSELDKQNLQFEVIPVESIALNMLG